MSQQSKTQPLHVIPKLDQAIDLAKAGQKQAAHDLLRRIVALQPVNQAAWLWLSAIAPDQSEAEAALAQARHIDPAHYALPKAEQWLAKRFSTQPPTQPMPSLQISEGEIPAQDSLEQPQVATSEDAPCPPAVPSLSEKTKSLSLGIPLLAVGLIALFVVIALGVFFLGLTLDVRAITQSEPLPEERVSVEEAKVDTRVDDRATELRRAESRGEWPNVIASLQESLTEAEQPATQQQLAQAYQQYGLVLRQQGRVEEALTQFEAALELVLRQPEIDLEIDLANRYLVGSQQYQAGQWADVIEELSVVYKVEPTYADVRDLLFSAYYNQSLALEAAAELSEAKEAMAAAIALRPDLAEPRRQMANLDFALAPEEPPAMPIPGVPLDERLVIVGIAEQRMYVYERGRKVFDFIVSTGEPGRDTAVGEFEIQNKIDMAYASTWNLDMPYWLGIYWAGPLQNGIHSLPTVRHTGYTLWDGYLGQRVSYGCVILGYDDAETLYDWAEVGTKVKIVPSLAGWSREAF